MGVFERLRLLNRVKPWHLNAEIAFTHELNPSRSMLKIIGGRLEGVTPLFAWAILMRISKHFRGRSVSWSNQKSLASGHQWAVKTVVLKCGNFLCNIKQVDSGKRIPEQSIDVLTYESTAEFSSCSFVILSENVTSNQQQQNRFISMEAI